MPPGTSTKRRNLRKLNEDRILHSDETLLHKGSNPTVAGVVRHRLAWRIADMAGCLAEVPVAWGRVITNP